MEATIFMAKAFGIFFVVMGLAALLRPAILKNLMKELSEDSSVMFLLGLMTLMLGIPLVLIHNIWNGTLEIIISLIAWATLLKGIFFMFAPQAFGGIAKSVAGAKWLNALMVLVIILGAYLMYAGFGFGA